MSDTRECPLCGGTMHLKVTTTVSHIPGYDDPDPKKTLEWVCPDCDYFEEADDYRENA
jgi:rubredoxin